MEKLFAEEKFRNTQSSTIRVQHFPFQRPYIQNKTVIIIFSYFDIEGKKSSSYVISGWIIIASEFSSWLQVSFFCRKFHVLVFPSKIYKSRGSCLGPRNCAIDDLFSWQHTFILPPHAKKLVQAAFEKDTFAKEKHRNEGNHLQLTEKSSELVSTGKLRM